MYFNVNGYFKFQSPAKKINIETKENYTFKLYEKGTCRTSSQEHFFTKNAYTKNTISGFRILTVTQHSCKIYFLKVQYLI
jgi:hypothetical protein